MSFTDMRRTCERDTKARLSSLSGHLLLFLADNMKKVEVEVNVGNY